MGDSQTGEQLYHRSPPTGVKVLSPTSGFPTCGSGNGRRNSQRIRFWRIAGIYCSTSTGLGETETPNLEGTHKVVCATGPRGKEQGPHRRFNQTYLLVLEGLLQRPWGVGAVAHHGEKDTGSRSSGKYSLAWAFQESATSPTKEPVASSTGSPQPKQPTGRELSRQVDESFTELCPPEQHRALPTTSPSHQEACTSLLDSLIHQRADSRSKKNCNPAACGMKTTFTER